MVWDLLNLHPIIIYFHVIPQLYRFTKRWGNRVSLLLGTNIAQSGEMKVDSFTEVQRTYSQYICCELRGCQLHAQSIVTT